MSLALRLFELALTAPLKVAVTPTPALLQKGVAGASVGRLDCKRPRADSMVSAGGGDVTALSGKLMPMLLGGILTRASAPSTTASAPRTRKGGRISRHRRSAADSFSRAALSPCAASRGVA